MKTKDFHMRSSADEQKYWDTLVDQLGFKSKTELIRFAITMITHMTRVTVAVKNWKRRFR